MQIFSNVVADVSPDVIALFPPVYRKGDDACVETDQSLHHCNAQLDVNRNCNARERAIAAGDQSIHHKAMFLDTTLKQMCVNVSVMCTVDDSTKTAFVKVCGSWRQLEEVQSWLSQWVENYVSDKGSHGSDADAILYQISTRGRCKNDKLSVVDNELEKSSHSDENEQVSNQLVLKVNVGRKCKQKSRKSRSKRVQRSSKIDLVLQTTADNTTEFGDVGCEISELSNSKINICTDNDDCNNKSDADTLSLCVQQRDVVPLIAQDDINWSESNQHAESASAKVSEEPKSAECRCTISTCEYFTKNERSLSLHKARVHGDRIFSCPTCNHSFAVIKDLKQHIKVHDETYCCEHCGQTLKSKYALFLHIARIHHGAAPRPLKHYLCTLCGKLCRNKTDYTAHRNKEHTGVRPFRCEVCNAEFYARSNLRAHSQIHSEERTFKCKHCDKAFKQRQGLRVHLAVHAATRPYKCEQCSKAFTQRGALVRHARTHTSERPYACRLCSATFNDYSILRRHMLGIHKMNDATVLRDSVKAACAEARLLEKCNSTTTPVSDILHDKAVISLIDTESELRADGVISTCKIDDDVTVAENDSDLVVSRSADSAYISVQSTELQPDPAYIDLLANYLSRTEGADDRIHPPVTATQILAFLPQFASPSLFSLVPDGTASHCQVVDDNLIQTVRNDRPQYVYMSKPPQE